MSPDRSKQAPVRSSTNALLLFLLPAFGFGLLDRSAQKPLPDPAGCPSIMPEAPAPAPPPGGGFVVAVATKNATHPQFGIGIGVGFVVNGVQGMELFLIRGTTYSFTVSGGHPFAFSTSVIGGPANIGQSFPTGNGITGTPTGSGTVTFTPNATHPNLMYYVCNAHENMGWKINVSDPPLLLNMKLMLEGPYDDGTQTMSDALRAAGLVPTSQPFTALGYPTVTGTTTGAVLAVTGNNAVVDWVVAELRDINDPSTVIQRRTGLVQRDGDVVGTDGSSPLQFTQPAGDYLVAVRHRNHLGVLTQDPITLTTTAAELDFRSSSTVVAGTDQRRDVNGVLVLWSGDVSFNGQVLYTGSGNDRDQVLSAIGGVIPTNTVNGQYRQEDLNMDASVKYTGADNDRDMILSAIGGVIPTASRTDAIP